MSQLKFAHTLKKNTYLSGLHCARRMWWEIHEKGAPELQHGIATQNRFDQGHQVGALAREYVPGGILIQRDQGNFVTSFAQSREAIADPNVGVIYEAGFVAHDTMIFADILVRGEDGFTLIEVKSGTSVTEQHIYDIGIQAVVMREAGVRIARFELMHLNRECRYPDLSNLFVRADVTQDVEDALAEIEHGLDFLLPIAKGRELPQAELGAHCSKPRECAFIDRCWPKVEADNIRYLYRLSREKALGYEKDGISRIQDLPDELQLGAIPARQRRCLREGNVLIERSELLAALRSVVHPVAHIDFETVMFAIPRWDGCRPYDTIPVQMSAHIVDAAGNARHHSWIAIDASDPRPKIGPAIVAACDGAKTITAYNSSFEKRCIEFVADACPDLAPRLREIAGSIVDLLPIVRDNIYHRDFRGSFSLKKVIPALTNVRYDDLEIAEGDRASAYLTLMLYRENALSEGDRAKLESQLLAYCQRDTAAMIALTQRLMELARS